MIGRFDITNASFTTDENGNLNAIFTAAPNSKYAGRETVRAVKAIIAQGKELAVKVEEKRNPRTLDQNALMWALLTIYADEVNGGRTGGVQPEDIYYRMLEQYGIATFLLTIPEAEADLKDVYRIVKRVDEREYNGKQMYMYKCCKGSSKYNTQQMTNLIDGIFDELAKLGISEKNYKDVENYRDEWKGK